MTRGWSRPSRRELALLFAAIAIGVALRVAFLLLADDHRLANDEYEYDVEARFAAEGRFLWSDVVYGEARPTAWKAPGYPAWLGLVYSVFGPNARAAVLLQAALFSPLTMVLAWCLGRRLFTPGVGVATALVCAVHPNVWQFDVLLYSEALATPLTVGLLLVVLPAVRVGWRRAALAGVLVGTSMLVRPTSILLIGGIAVMWWARAGARRGTAMLALSLAGAALVVTPWTLRNHALWPDRLIPISLQSAAGYGVFNDQAANDPVNPWLWRPEPPSARRIFATPRADDELFADLNRLWLDYVRDHPTAVLEAFYWNGIRRLWDLRPPGEALYEVPFEGRRRLVTAVGLALYWVLLPLAFFGLVGLWRGGRRAPVLAVAAIVLGASVVFTVAAGTRYRAPLEPLIAVLATSAVLPRLPRFEAWVSGRKAATAALPHAPRP